MIRIEVDAMTGERREIALTAEEIVEAQARAAAEQAERDAATVDPVAKLAAIMARRFCSYSSIGTWWRLAAGERPANGGGRIASLAPRHMPTRLGAERALSRKRCGSTCSAQREL